MHRFVVWVGVALIATACGGGTPEVVSERPNLEACQQDEVFIPIRQGPAKTQAQSQAALDCFLQHHESGDPAGLAFTLVGTEGGQYEAILQTLPDGTISYFTHTDDWTIRQQCESISVDPVPSVSGCLRTNVLDDDPAAPVDSESGESVQPFDGSTFS